MRRENGRARVPGRGNLMIRLMRVKGSRDIAATTFSSKRHAANGELSRTDVIDIEPMSVLSLNSVIVSDFSCSPNV